MMGGGTFALDRRQDQPTPIRTVLSASGVASAPYVRLEGKPMATPDETSAPPPDWAMQLAREELYDEQDADGIIRRAHDIADQARQRNDEMHDEYDDPDQGGEA